MSNSFLRIATACRGSMEEPRTCAPQSHPIGTTIFLACWAGILLFIGSVLMSGHWIVLPSPAKDDPHMLAAIETLSPEGNAARPWQMTHVLYADCRCSQRIFEYLLTRPTPSDAAERVLLVGDEADFSERAERRGLEVVSVTPEELESRFHIESAPLLLITDPCGQVRYAGGYTARKQGPDYRDLAVLTSLQACGEADELPLFGCGVSRDLQRALDPLGVKYAR